MKKTYFNILALLLLPLLYYAVFTGFSATENSSLNIEPKTTPPGPTSQKDFVNFILNSDYSDYSSPGGHHMENFLDKFGAELNFNGVHLYDADSGTTELGPFNYPINGTQKTKVENLIAGAHSETLKAIYERSNISNLLYAQRLVYEVANGSGHIDENDGFCYQDISGVYEEEPDGTTAIHACVNPSECNTQNWDAIPQYICSNIYENLQHTDLPHFRPQERDKWDWHLKPRMKIKQTDFEDPNKQTLPVVTIYVYAFDGSEITTKTILVRNFSKQGISYYGDYKEIFYQGLDEMNMWIPGNETNGLNKGRDVYPWWQWDANCKVDFKIYWHGNVDVWFDKLTVDDYRANILFAPPPFNFYEPFLNAELQNFGSSMDMFFVDELVYSNIPCAKYVIDKVKLSHPNVKICFATTNYLNVHGLKNDALGFEPFMTAIQPKYFQTDSHEFFGARNPATGEYWGNYYPDNLTDINSSVPSGYSPSGWKVSRETYNNWLQNNVLGHKTSHANEPGTFIYQIRLARDHSNTYSPGTSLIVQPQIQGLLRDKGPDGKYDDGLREPLNEEYSVQAMISIAHGADGLSWFWFQGYEGNSAASNPGIHFPNYRFTDMAPTGIDYIYGLINFNTNVPRTENIWKQNKWQGVSDVNAKILGWKQTLNAAVWQSGYSVHSEGSGHEYISDIQSIYRDPFDLSYIPINQDEIKYWEMGFYNNSSNANTKYFLMANRRCIPEIPLNSGAGDLRQLKIKFNGSVLPQYQNWAVYEIKENGALQHKVTFPRSSASFYDFGTFQPGEGKLYKLEPVMKSGGTLVADEVISGESFTCETPVYNNGFNITIGANTTIHFNDSSKFVMDGGVFTVGDQNTSAPQNITSDAVSGSLWSGHSFTNSEVKIYGATFTGLANDTTYAVNIIDCPVVDIRNSTFNTNSSLKGGVNAVFFSDPNNEISLSNIYIGANTFNSSGSTIPTVNISSYAGETTPLIIENNIFNEGNTAIFLSGITGGAIKGNSITDNFIGINALTSSIDIKSNTISSTVNNAIGIFAAGGSELKMNNAGSKTLGGLNDLSNSGTAANNIVVDGSVFLLDGGENIFNITDDQTSKHLYGYFPQFTQGPFDETNNCFKLYSSPVDPPYNMVTSGFQGSQITFNFTPYLSGCEANEGGDGFAINLGDGIYDTIYNEGSGSGGSNNQIPLSRGVTAEGSRGVFVITTAKQRYDSISVLMRYRNYSQARTKCLDLINTYPDSIQSLNAVSKLFLSTVASDTTYNAVNELKTYNENLILNNSGNVSLVKRANYYILKCKVRMREYSQALAGFQQIINQNPYSYEGLIARWDYMATSLLIQGQGGSYSSIDNDQLAMNNYDIDGNDHDKKPFTKEQRQDIRKSINTAIEVTKDEDDRKIKTLEVKSEQGDVNASKELEQIKTLKQVVKTERPKSITEHVRMVSEDIRKVFGSNTSSKGNEPKNIPLVFKLSQNYPNPFNPVTKINYDLPKDSKVKIVIYDILGREVKRLVNSEFKTAGSYIVDFNASNFASGVYFYRIEAEEPNGNKFVDSKKMVLLK